MGYLKKIFPLFFLTIFCSEISFAQNLVPNPSFEQFLQCPSNISQINYCMNWYNATDSSSGETPDFFHSCSSINGIAPPNCTWGYQIPFSGNGYCFVATYAQPFPNLREIMQAQLVQPLIIGQEYYLSIQASLPFDVLHSIATNKLGALFTTYQFTAPNFAHPINFAHVYTDSIITDTLNWHQIKGSFIADSAYQYISIGNFFDDLNTDTLILDGMNSYIGGYYIDNICLSSDSNICYPTSVPEINFNNQIFVNPNPTNDYFIIRAMNVKSLSVFNQLGQKVPYTKISISPQEIKIDCSQWEAGIYCLQTEYYSHKILIIR